MSFSDPAAEAWRRLLSFATDPLPEPLFRPPVFSPPGFPAPPFAAGPEEFGVPVGSPAWRVEATRHYPTAAPPAGSYLPDQRGLFSAGGYAPPAGPLRYQSFEDVIDQLRRAIDTGQTVQIGNVVYDPRQDVERWWHGDAANRFQRGESSANRVLRWLIEAAQGRRDHKGYVNPSDPAATFAAIVNQLMGQVRTRKKGPRDTSLYGFRFV